MMNAQLESMVPNEKLNMHNNASWEYKMHQYLVRQGIWSYINGAQEIALDLINSHYTMWQKGAHHVM